MEIYSLILVQVFYLIVGSFDEMPINIHVEMWNGQLGVPSLGERAGLAIF